MVSTAHCLHFVPKSQPCERTLRRRFFEEYLPHLRGMSAHTIRSYRVALVLLLRFAATDAGRPVERLAIKDLDHGRVTRLLVAERPEHLAMLQGVLAVPFKRGGAKD